MSDLSRRVVLGAGAWPQWACSAPISPVDRPGHPRSQHRCPHRGYPRDEPGRAGTSQPPDCLQQDPPDIKVRIQAVQGQDWSNFFAKILTMVAAGSPPDVCVVATEGAQLFADRLAEPSMTTSSGTPPSCRTTSGDVHPSLIEAFMYRGRLYQLPIDFNAANVYYNTSTFQKAGIERPPDTWTG